MEQKALHLEVKAEDEEGVISGYGAVFGNVDSHGDRIMKGCFTESLKMRMPKMLWQHNMADPIGRWESVMEDDKGLLMKGRIAIKSSRGRDAYELVKAGAIDGLSIGYATQDYEMDGAIRVLKSVGLYETSLVTMPSNSMAMVQDVKNADIRDIESAFRQMGFSRTEAKGMASGAWERRERILREADALGPEIVQREVDELKQLLTSILQ